MAGRILNRFEELLAVKQRRDGVRLSYRDVSDATGINKNTISFWVRNFVTNFDSEILVALCEYLECDVGDLLYYEPDKEE